MRIELVAAALLTAGLACLVVPDSGAQTAPRTAAIELWAAGKPAFGVFVPNENASPRPSAVPPAGAPPPAAGPRPTPRYTRAGGERLAANPLYDFVFLNLESAFDEAAVRAIAEGLRASSPPGHATLIVRVPAFHEDPAAGRTRIRTVFAAGADGITFPHVESIAEGRQILAAAAAEKIDVWSPATPRGDKIVMMMIEDPKALAEAPAFADLGGYSILACGIGSLTQALGGDRAGAEAGTQKVLAETKRVHLVNMLTATTADVQQRVTEGFLGILAQGRDADEAIRAGRAAAGR